MQITDRQSEYARIHDIHLPLAYIEVCHQEPIVKPELALWSGLALSNFLSDVGFLSRHLFSARELQGICE